MSRAQSGDYPQDEIDWSKLGEIRFLEPEVEEEAEEKGVNGSAALRVL